jgi:2-dehydro-3-deoxyphosphogluconate aldolase/(4S)-4-hydroxy-2-oxoglutarate aldolase
MYRTGIVPIFNHPDADICKQLLKACYEAGVRVFEFTNRGDYAHEVFSELNKYAARELPGMMLGAGSVPDAGTASLYMQLGANFIVSPAINAEMAKVCNSRKVAWLPGCGSVTELAYAEELGAEVIKMFPAIQVGGPDFVSAVRGPRPWSSIMPTGGVEPSEESLIKWFEAGVHCVGLGSQMIVKKADSSYDFDAIKAKLQGAFTAVKKFRS